MEALEDGGPMKWQKLGAGIIRQRLPPKYLTRLSSEQEIH